MRFRLLGPLEADQHGRIVDLGGPRQRAVLAALLLRANEPVGIDYLTDAVWETPPARPASNIRTYVSGLRRQLQEPGTDSPRLVTCPGGYLLAVHAEELDLACFDKLAARADQAVRAGDRAVAASLFKQALALWRGQPLQGQPTGHLLQSELTRLQERRLSVIERYAHARIDLGQYEDVIDDLRRWVAESPLREELWCKLVLALYRSGRHADALDAFDQVQGKLAQELGIEPSPALQLLRDRILARDPALDGPPQTKPEPPQPTPAQLPHDAPGFIGRTPELAELKNLIGRADNAAVVISAIDGTAGVGKTALAVHFGHQVAGQFPDGQLYLDLHGYAAAPPMTTTDALGRLLRALGLPPERIPVEEQEQATTYRSLLAGRRMLVVLDNARTAEQVRPLLPGHPGCVALITSRTTLATLDGATHLHLDVLTDDEALILLARLAGAERVAADPRTAKELVRLCARLPLAVRIAAARLAARPTWPISALVDRLADQQRRLDELQVADRAIRASFAVSDHALRASADPVDRAAARVFRRLGVLNWVELSVPVAAALADLPALETQAALERLVDDHLLDSPSPGRYHTHDLLHLYARDRANHDEAEPERHAARQRALTCYLAAAEQATRLLNPPAAFRRVAADPRPCAHGGFTVSTPSEATAWTEAERANLLAAAHQAHTTSALIVRLTAALSVPFDFCGYWHDLIILHRLAADTARHFGDESGEALAHEDRGYAYAQLGRTDESITNTQQALTLHRQTGDRHSEQFCLNHLGFAYSQQERFAEAITSLDQALSISREIGYRYGEANALDGLGLIHQRLHRFDDAITCHRQSLAIQRDIGNRHREAIALANLGWAHYRAGDPDQAIACHQQSLTIKQTTGHRYGQAESLWGLGQSHHALGQHERARTYWQRSISILHDIDALTTEETEQLRHQPIPDTPEIIKRNI